MPLNNSFCPWTFVEANRDYIVDIDAVCVFCLFAVSKVLLISILE